MLRQSWAITLTHVRMLLAGADIQEMKQLTFVKAYTNNFLADLDNGIKAIRKPIIAAINGYAVRNARSREVQAWS